MDSFFKSVQNFTCQGKDIEHLNRRMTGLENNVVRKLEEENRVLKKELKDTRILILDKLTEMMSNNQIQAVDLPVKQTSCSLNDSKTMGNSHNPTLQRSSYFDVSNEESTERENCEKDVLQERLCRAMTDFFLELGLGMERHVAEVKDGLAEVKSSIEDTGAAVTGAKSTLEETWQEVKHVRCNLIDTNATIEGFNTYMNNSQDTAHAAAMEAIQKAVGNNFAVINQMERMLHETKTQIKDLDHNINNFMNQFKKKESPPPPQDEKATERRTTNSNDSRIDPPPCKAADGGPALRPAPPPPPYKLSIFNVIL